MGPLYLCSFPVLYFFEVKWINDLGGCSALQSLSLFTAQPPRAAPGNAPRHAANAKKINTNCFFFNKVPNWNSTRVLVKHSDAGWPLGDIFSACVHQERPTQALTAPHYSSMASAPSWDAARLLKSKHCNGEVRCVTTRFIDHSLLHGHNSTLRELHKAPVLMASGHRPVLTK